MFMFCVIQMSSGTDRISYALWCTDKRYYSLLLLYYIFLQTYVCAVSGKLWHHTVLSLSIMHQKIRASACCQSHLDACRYSLCQVMLAASFVSCKSSSSSPQPRYGIHNYSQRPSLANAFPPPGVSTYSRNCDALEDTVEKLLRDKKTPINLSCPMD